MKYSFNTLYMSCNKCGLQIYTKYKKLKTAALLDTVEFVHVGTVVCYISLSYHSQYGRKKNKSIANIFDYVNEIDKWNSNVAFRIINDVTLD